MIMRVSEKMAEGTLVASKSDGPGRVAAIDAWLCKNAASIVMSEGRLHSNNDYELNVHFRCSQEAMEAIEERYRDELFGYSVNIRRHDVLFIENPYVVRVLAQNECGIEATLMGYFARHGLNIAKHRSLVTQLPHCGGDVFVSEVWVGLPNIYNVVEFERALDVLAEEQKWMDILMLSNSEHKNSTLTEQLDDLAKR